MTPVSNGGTERLIPSGRIAEIRQENRGGDVSARDIEWLCRIAEAADGFHAAFWNPWRSGRSVVMTADKVAEAYGELRRALSQDGRVRNA